MLIRNARLVPLTEPAPQDLVDVLVEDGVVTRVSPGVVVDDGGTAHDDVVDAAGGWLMPGLELELFRRLKRRRAIRSQAGNPYRITRRGLELVRSQPDNR